MEPEELLGEHASHLPDTSFINFERRPESLIEGEHVLLLSQEKQGLSQSYRLSESMRRVFGVDKYRGQGIATNESSHSRQSDIKFLLPTSVASHKVNVEPMMMNESSLGSLENTTNEGNSRRGPLKNVSVNFTLSSTESSQDSSLFAKKSRDRKLFRPSVNLPSLDSTKANEFTPESSRDEVILSQETSIPNFRTAPRPSVKLPSLDSSEKSRDGPLTPVSSSANARADESSPVVEMNVLRCPVELTFSKSIQEKSADNRSFLGSVKENSIAESQPKSSLRSSLDEESPGLTERVAVELDTEVASTRETPSTSNYILVRTISEKFPVSNKNDESIKNDVAQDSTMDIDESAFAVEEVVMESQEQPKLNVKGASVNFNSQSLSHDEVVSSQDTSVPVIQTAARRSVNLPSLLSSFETTEGHLTQDSRKNIVIGDSSKTGESNAVCDTRKSGSAIFRVSVEIPSMTATQVEPVRDVHGNGNKEIVVGSQPETIPEPSSQEEHFRINLKGASVNFTLDSLSQAEVFSSQETSIPDRRKTRSESMARASVKLPPLDSSFEVTELPLTQETIREPQVAHSLTTIPEVANFPDDPSSQKEVNLKLVSVNVSLNSATSRFESLSSQESDIGKPSEGKLQRFSVKLPSLDANEEHSLHLNCLSPSPKEMLFSAIDLPSKIASPPRLDNSVEEPRAEDIEFCPIKEPDVESDDFQLVLSPGSAEENYEIEEDGFDRKSKSSSVSIDRMTENNELEIFEEFLSREITEDIHDEQGHKSTRSESSTEGSHELRTQSTENKSREISDEISSDEKEYPKANKDSPRPTTPAECYERIDSPQDSQLSSKLEFSSRKSAEPSQTKQLEKLKKRTRKSFDSILASQGLKESSFPQERSSRNLRKIRRSTVENLKNPSISSDKPNENIAPLKSFDSIKRKRSNVEQSTTPILRSPPRKSSRIMKGKAQGSNKDPDPAPAPRPRENNDQFETRAHSSKGGSRSASSGMLMSPDISEVREQAQSAVDNATSEDSAPLKKFTHYVSTPFKKRSSVKTFAVPKKPALKMRRKGRVSFRPGDSVIAMESEEEPKSRKPRQKVEEEADFSFGSALDVSEIPKLRSRAHSTPISEARRRGSKDQFSLQFQSGRKTSAQVQTTLSESSERTTKSKSSSIRVSSSGTSALASQSHPLNESSAVDRPPDSFRSGVESSISAVPSLRQSNRASKSKNSTTVVSSVSEIEPEKEDKTLVDIYKRRQIKRVDVTLPRPRTTRGKVKSALSPETFKSLGLPMVANKRFKPAKWVTNDLYNHLEKKLVSKYGLDTRVISEKIVTAMHITYVKIQKKHCAKDDIDELKSVLADYGVCYNRLMFGVFLHKFTPARFFLNAVSCGGVKGSTLPSDGGLVYDPLSCPKT